MSTPAATFNDGYSTFKFDLTLFIAENQDEEIKEIKIPIFSLGKTQEKAKENAENYWKNLLGFIPSLEEPKEAMDPNDNIVFINEGYNYYEEY